MHISGCFDNENGALIPGGVAKGSRVCNNKLASAMTRVSAAFDARIELIFGSPYIVRRKPVDVVQAVSTTAAKNAVSLGDSLACPDENSVKTYPH